MLKSIAVIVFSLLGVTAAGAESQYHFKVANRTSGDITKLQVSADKKTWGNFDVGDGVKAGETETFVWDESTDSEPCNQWIRAKFSDGEWSEASKQNFCKDLETPIEFSE